MVGYGCRRAERHGGPLFSRRWCTERASRVISSSQGDESLNDSKQNLSTVEDPIRMCDGVRNVDLNGCHLGGWCRVFMDGILHYSESRSTYKRYKIYVIESCLMSDDEGRNASQGRAGHWSPSGAAHRATKSIGYLKY